MSLFFAKHSDDDDDGKYFSAERQYSRVSSHNTSLVSFCFCLFETFFECFSFCPSVLTLSVYPHTLSVYPHTLSFFSSMSKPSSSPTAIAALFAAVAAHPTLPLPLSWSQNESSRSFSLSFFYFLSLYLSLSFFLFIIICMPF
jgi:hypothetical protein